ncbi:MAG: hypothetical protein AVDCRST_MAG38-1222, partial [uncultured Solirubrobacteraceae bacterium]
DRARPRHAGGDGGGRAGDRAHRWGGGRRTAGKPDRRRDGDGIHAVGGTGYVRARRPRLRRAPGPRRRQPVTAAAVFLPAGGDHDHRRRRRDPARLLRPLVPELRRALRAAVGARLLAGSPPRVPRRLRAHAASAADGRQLAGTALRRARRAGDRLDRPAVFRRRRLADLPARRGALPSGRRSRRRAGRLHPPGVPARRAALLPGRPLRGPDHRRRAAGEPLTAAWRAGARAAGPRRPAATGGVGARRPLRALPVAGAFAAPARDPRRARRAGAGRLGDHRLARHRRLPALAARHRGAGRGGRTAAAHRAGPLLDGAVLRLHAARAARAGHPDRAGLRLASRPPALVAAAGHRPCDDRGLRDRAAVRPAADRPLRPHAGRPAVPLLRPRRVRLAAPAAGPLTPALADRRRRRAGRLDRLHPLARRDAAGPGAPHGTRRRPLPPAAGGGHLARRPRGLRALRSAVDRRPPADPLHPLLARRPARLGRDDQERRQPDGRPVPRAPPHPAAAPYVPRELPRVHRAGRLPPLVPERLVAGLGGARVRHTSSSV